MEIYLMQHGIPFPKDKDPEQGLSPEGIDQVRVSGRALKRMGVSLDAIVSSPKKRSQQTAAIVAKELALATDKIIETEKVKPMAPAIDAVDFLIGLVNRNRILIAGHLPSVAEIASTLLTERSKVFINFQMGGVCRIDVDTLPTHSGVLQWYLRPDQLRLLGG